MKIVIAGAGEVGTHLARMLSDEQHDIILMDESQELLQHISNETDLLTVKGIAHSIEDLKKAGVSNSDLFIAITPYEEQNVWSCSLAKYLGVKRTIARINSSEYLKREYKEKLNDLGINELIYPETLAAKEIVASIKQTGARHMISFENDALILMGVEVNNSCTLFDQSLQDLSLVNHNIFIAAINRMGQTIIPSGHDIIKPGDVVYFISPGNEQQRIFDITGKEQYKIRDIMFLGGSRIAQKTIQKLNEIGKYNMKVIENDIVRCEAIAEKFSNVLVIQGDCRSLELLKAEGIEGMDAVIATTGSSETNIICSSLAKRMGIKQTIAEVENLDFMNTAYTMSLGAVVNKKLIAASYIYRFTLNAEIANVKILSGTDAEVFEFIVKPGARITTKPIKDLHFPSNANIGGYIRNGRGSVAYGNTRIEAGDRVIVFTVPTSIRILESFFK